MIQSPQCSQCGALSHYVFKFDEVRWLCSQCGAWLPILDTERVEVHTRPVLTLIKGGLWGLP